MINSQTVTRNVLHAKGNESARKDRNVHLCIIIIIIIHIKILISVLSRRDSARMMPSSARREHQERRRGGQADGSNLPNSARSWNRAVRTGSNMKQNKTARWYANAALGSVTNQCDRLISEEPGSSLCPFLVLVFLNLSDASCRSPS